ncbi:MAG: hypothetical protein P8Z75_16055, partial [Gammaproteobacteria bacterium]
MLNQFKRMDMHKSEACRVDVNNVLRRIETKCADDKPLPRIQLLEAPVYVYVEADRFENVIEHMVSNAQDATSDDGRIEVRVLGKNNEVCIEIED